MGIRFKDFIAFLDIKPAVKGHSLLIPKKHTRWTYDVPDFGKYWETALLITRAVQNAFKTKYVNYYTYGVVPHAHIHILPRTTEVGTVNNRGELDIIPPEIQVNDLEMGEIAEKIRKNII